MRPEPELRHLPPVVCSGPPRCAVPNLSGPGDHGFVYVCVFLHVCVCVRACLCTRESVCARECVCEYVRASLSSCRFLQCVLSLSAVPLSLAFCSASLSRFLQCVLSFSAVSFSRFLQRLLSLSAVCTCAHKRSLPFSLPSFHPSIPPHLLTLPTPRAGNVDVGGHNTTSSTDKV